MPLQLKKLLDHAGFRKYFKNTSWMFGTRIATMAMSFIATLYIARNLGPTNYGQLSYAMSFVALFGFLATLGTESILYRELIRYPERRSLLLGTVFVIRFSAGIFAALLAIVFGFIFTGSDVSNTLIPILSAAFILNSFQIILYEFQARSDPTYPSLVAITIAFIVNAAKILVIVSGQGVIYLALTLLLESVLNAVFYTAIYTHRTKESLFTWRYSGSHARSILIDSLPVVAFSAFSVVYSRIDQVLIKYFMDAHAVGIYSAAAQVGEIWSFIPGLLLAALAPSIVRAKEISDELYTQRLARLSILLLGISILVAIVVTVLAPLFIQILYGAQFMEGVSTLRIYIWAFIGTSLSIVMTQYLITENYRTILTFSTLFPMLINIGLNILWIPIYGINGAAYATLIAYSSVPLMLLLFPRTRKRLGAVTIAASISLLRIAGFSR